MDIINLCKMIELLTDIKVNPIRFSETFGTETKLEITTGMVESGGIYDFNIEISVKAEHPSICEGICLDLINKLHRKTDIDFNGHQLVLCQADKPYPFYVGQMETGEYLFNCSFRLLTAKL